jgi:hypothetical protein
MPGETGVTVVTNARVFYTTRAAAGASSAQHSLRPLIRGRKVHDKTRAKTRGEIVKSCLDVIARSEATKQSTLPLPHDGLLRCARNDGSWLFEI